MLQAAAPSHKKTHGMKSPVLGSIKGRALGVPPLVTHATNSQKLEIAGNRSARRRGAAFRVGSMSGSLEESSGVYSGLYTRTRGRATSRKEREMEGGPISGALLIPTMNLLADTRFSDAGH